VTVSKQHKRVSRSEKKIILDEFCTTTRYHHKYVTILLKCIKWFRKRCRWSDGKLHYQKNEIM